VETAQRRGIGRGLDQSAANEARQARKEFETHLRELGLDPEGTQDTKTRTALEHFAAILKEAGS
jgi:hypothetical protein